MHCRPQLCLVALASYRLVSICTPAPLPLLQQPQPSWIATATAALGGVTPPWRSNRKALLPMTCVVPFRLAVTTSNTGTGSRHDNDTEPSQHPNQENIDSDEDDKNQNSQKDRKDDDAFLVVLAKELNQAYMDGGTDGVMNLAIQHRQSTLRCLTPTMLFQAVQQALQQQGQTKGVGASMINAWIASHYRHMITKSCNDTMDMVSSDKNSSGIIQKNHHHKSNHAPIDILNYWEQKAAQDESLFQPDIVSYALTYAAAAAAEDAAAKDDAKAILEKGLRYSKKLAGSKRRKALAAARRHAPDTVTNRLDDIRALLLLSSDNNDDKEEFDVLMETPDFVVIHKPAGVVCSHRILTTAGKTTRIRRSSATMNKNQGQDGDESESESMETNNSKEKRTKKKKKGSDHARTTATDSDISLIDALLHCHVPLSTLNPECQGLVHRLDRGTSGCLFLAKTNAAHAEAMAEFYCRRASKTYLTLVVSSSSPSSSSSSLLETQDQGDIHLPVDGRPARSFFRVLERFRPTGPAMHADWSPPSPQSVNVDVDHNVSKNKGVFLAALLQLTTHTGRKHQVRVHAAQGLNAPVLGDTMYMMHNKNGHVDVHDAMIHSQRTAPAANVRKPASPTTTAAKERFFLHAQKLSLPSLGVNVEAPPPEWWMPTLNALRQQDSSEKD
ncbi:hypothetical protein ACA910_021408 [Epithemia clementina (nom. ined.)]